MLPRSRRAMSLSFPNGTGSFAVLRRAIDVNPKDATTHFLLYPSGGMSQEASQEWETARSVNPAIPALHRNMGYTVLKSGGLPERAVELFRIGARYDVHNVDVYLGLEETSANSRTPRHEKSSGTAEFPGLAVSSNRSDIQAGERARGCARLRFRGKAAGRPILRARRGRRQSPRDLCFAANQARPVHGGAGAVPCRARCGRHLGEPVASLPFTAKGLEPFISSAAGK
jgi:hypothetical protein